MPELPEVETVRRGIMPLITGQQVRSVVCRVPKLRWDLCGDLQRQLSGQVFRTVERRAKYLLLRLDRGALVIHLGMTGILRVVEPSVAPSKHDHVDIVLETGRILRMNDSRRFGAVFYTEDPVEFHPLLRDLGPEPLSDDFSAKYLHGLARRRTAPCKNVIMDQSVVVGVGNIYACEALFRAGIDPRRAADRISLKRYDRLVTDIKSILREAIEEGGTTIRDFEGTDGKPGYFRQRLAVYGREGKPCRSCSTPIRNVRLGGRSTFYCPECQR